MGQSNVLYLSVILFTGEGRYPWSHVPSESLYQEGVSVQRGLCLGVSVQEFSVQEGVSVRRGSLSVGPCPSQSLLGGSMSGGMLCQEEVSVRPPPRDYGGRSRGVHLSGMLSCVNLFDIIVTGLYRSRGL